MNKKVHIIGIAGSLRLDSYNKAALRAAQNLLPENADLEILDISDIPGFNQDMEKNFPPKAAELKKKIREADAILISTPEYNYSIPGVLKNAIDWTSRPYGDSAWNGKPVAIMGVSSGQFGTARAQYHLRQVFVFLNVFTLNQPEVMIAFAKDQFDEKGNLTNETSKSLMKKLLQNLVDLVGNNKRE